jgi:valyl-tRNA synthetase
MNEKRTIDEFPQHFEHASREREIYEAWESSGAFRADNQSQRKPFVISMPPPNATGTLHLGHAVMLAIEDLMIRWRRMAGDEALWVPGTDHAAIATESAVIKQLQKGGMKDPRRELGRDGLLQQIASYVASSRATIRSQIRAMGSSCDWSRERYTMDPELNRVVNETFGHMFRDGLIYRGNRIVNWDTALRTTVSDDEIYHEERDAFLYTIQYGEFQVATSRPETKLGDTALAVHPDDDRYKQYIGKEFDIAWPKGPTIRVRVVADPEVDPEFGTGVVGVTPAHSPIDFDIAQRHGLPLVVVIGEDGRMTPAAGSYAGLSINQCRTAFVADLDAAGLLLEKKAYKQNVGLCYRSGKPVEYLPKEQWFIDVNRPAVRWDGKLMSIRQVMADVVRSHRIRIIPEHQEKTYFHWIDNLNDWCISRQIWWGHRVPVWYRGNAETYAGARVPEGEGWAQDSDTLDTWFSSALWTWSTLVDAEATKDLTLTLKEILERSPDYRFFHPTTVMETGYDILFFWVARMILMTTYVTGQVPFEKVYLHGLVLDKNGDKMSKSNAELCIDPLEVIGQRGADTLRLALVTGNSAGTDARMSDDKIKGASRFINKLWNAAKFVAANADFGPAEPRVSHPVNRWMVKRMSDTVMEVTAAFERYSFGDAADTLRNAFWKDFCDFYLEATKADELARLEETRLLLGHALETYLRLLHPLIPFVTEEIWTRTGHEGFLMQQSWPAAEVSIDDVATSEGVDALIRLVTAIGSWRAKRTLKWNVEIDVRLYPRLHADILDTCAPLLRKLGSVRIFERTRSEIEGEVITDEAFDLTIVQSQHHDDDGSELPSCNA